MVGCLPVLSPQDSDPRVIFFFFFVCCVVLAGEPNIPLWAIHAGKGLQNKSQFRTIAPKIAPQVLAPRLLPGLAPSLSDQANPGPSLSSTPLGMPPQNYALMQVAGQEGTFSLVALPHVASVQPIQKPRLPLPENLKLPIPRYQPPRPGTVVRKKPGLGFSSERSCSKPAQTQAAPSPPEHPEPPHKPSLPKPEPDQAPAALTNRSGHRDPRPQGPATMEVGLFLPPQHWPHQRSSSPSRASRRAQEERKFQARKLPGNLLLSPVKNLKNWSIPPKPFCRHQASLETRSRCPLPSPEVNCPSCPTRE